jgi:hypothetical protein
MLTSSDYVKIERETRIVCNFTAIDQMMTAYEDHCKQMARLYATRMKLTPESPRSDMLYFITDISKSISLYRRALVREVIQERCTTVNELVGLRRGPKQVKFLHAVFPSGTFNDDEITFAHWDIATEYVTNRTIMILLEEQNRIHNEIIQPKLEDVENLKGRLLFATRGINGRWKSVSNQRLYMIVKVTDEFLKPFQEEYRNYMSKQQRDESDVVVNTRNAINKLLECQHCHSQNAPLRCSICHTVRYCDQDCQRKHWRSTHRETCKAPERQFETSVFQEIKEKKAAAVAVVVEDEEEEHKK